MKNLRTHQWSTPATIAAGLFVASTGLFMFFIDEDPVKSTHEIAGVAFSAAIVVHVLSNWRSFRGYFTRGRAISIVATAWLIGTGLVFSSAVTGTEEAEQLVMDRIEDAPIATLAPVAGKDAQNLVAQLRSDGYPIEGPEISPAQLADAAGAEVDDVLQAVFSE